MISYKNLADSINYYDELGYSQIETPWTVTESISKLTKPEDRIDWKIHNKNKVLVGSAEQGFLYLALKGFLAPGKYQSVGPCFREEVFDLTHSKYFMKNELIITDEVNHAELIKMVNFAKEFFWRKIAKEDDEYEPSKLLDTKQTGKFSYDIEYKGIELGSYGIRETPILTYIYGTACAEPRLSYCKKLNK